MDWQPMSTAPKDGTRIRIRTETGRELDVSAYDGFLDGNGDDCWAWVAFDEDETPECWTDGVCWAENECGVPCDQPVAWKPISDDAE